MCKEKKCWICETLSNKEEENVQLEFSKLITGISICSECWATISKEILNQSGTYLTFEHIALFLALQRRLKDVEIKKDGLTITNDKNERYPFVADLSIPAAKLIIEVDGSHHFYNAERMMLDAKKTVQAKIDHDFSVIRVSNAALCTPSSSEGGKSMFVFVVNKLVALINKSINDK